MRVSMRHILALFALALAVPAWSQPKITGIEVNQSIGLQLNGNLNFVAGKDTTVRVFLDAPATIDTTATQTFLNVFRDGNLVATVSTANTGPTATLDFLCDRSACQNWAAGSYRFEATVNGGAKQTTDGTTYNFVPRIGLRILVRPVKANYGGVIASVRGDAWKTAWTFTRRAYPIASDQILWDVREELDASTLDLETEPGRQQLWTALTNLLPEHCLANPKGTGCYDLIVGFISDRPNGYPNGTLQGYTYGRPTNIVVASDEDMPATIAHEIGHIYGVGDTYDGGSLNCTVNPAPDGFNGKNFSDPSQPASCTAGRLTFPGASATLIPAATVHPYDLLQGALPDVADFMGSGTLQKNFWITPEVYNQLFNGLAPPAPSGSANRLANATPQRVLFFEGTITATGQIQTQPWSSGMSTDAVTDSTGATQIQGVDGSGNVLSSTSFNPQFFVLTNPPTTVNAAPFEGAVRFPDGVVKFQIVRSGAVLYEAKVSANDPVVSAVSPATSGLTLDGPQTITWTAADADGDSLTYMVEYNPRPNDPNSDWLVLTTNLTTPQWQDDFGTLPGAAAAAIRITATDGIRASSALSQNFAVSFKAPSVFVDALANSTFKTTDMIELTGEADDVQDGDLDGANLVWASDIAGKLGTGSEIHVTGLASGTHNITLTATNSAGLTTSQSIQIQIQ